MERRIVDEACQICQLAVADSEARVTVSGRSAGPIATRSPRRGSTLLWLCKGRRIFSPGALHVLRDVKFWQRMDLLHVVLSPMFGFDLWCRGCKCHEGALGLAHSADACRHKGCRGPELADKVHSMCEQARADIEELLAGDSVDSEQVAEGMQLHVESVSLLRSKFAWLNDAPWFLWQVDSSDTARMFLAKCDAQAGALHRVSHTFAGVGGQWRAQMQVWADGGEPTLALLRALWRYRSAKTDDTVQETPHKDVSYEAHRARSSKVVYAFACTRFDQNLQMWEDADEVEREISWVRWRSLAHRSVDAWLTRKRSREGLAATLINRVYRLKGVGLAGWGELAPFLRDLLPKAGIGALRISRRLRVDWMRRSLDVDYGSVFSIDFDEPPALLQHVCGAASLNARVFFQPAADSSNNKFVNSETRRQWKAMLMPIAVQFWEQRATCRW